MTNKNELKHEGVNLILLFALGSILGIFAKVIDVLCFEESFWLQDVLNYIDLRNILSRIPIWSCVALIVAVKSETAFKAALHVLVVLVSMCVGYYLYTRIVCGFNPLNYILRWGIVAVISPIFGVIVWYAKYSLSKVNIFLSSIVIAFFISQIFSFGMWYLAIRYYLEIIIMIVATIYLYRDKEQIILSVFGGIILSPFIKQAMLGILGMLKI